MNMTEAINAAVRGNKVRYKKWSDGSYMAWDEGKGLCLYTAMSEGVMTWCRSWLVGEWEILEESFSLFLPLDNVDLKIEMDGKYLTVTGGSTLKDTIRGAYTQIKKGEE